MGAVLIGLEIIANLIGRCAIYENLYMGDGSGSSIPFEEEIVRLYACILHFLARAKRYYSRNTAARILFSIFETELASLLNDIATQEACLLKAIDLAEALYHRTANTTVNNDIEKLSKDIFDRLERVTQEFEMPIARVESNIGKLCTSLADSERTEILMWLSKIEYEKHHANASNGRVVGTGEWLLRKKEFIQWQKSSASTIIWLRGIPGAGKTKLTSKVIDTIIRQQAFASGSSEALAYFYCKRDASGSTDPEIAMSAIVKQLCRLRPLLPLQDEVVTAYQARKQSGFSAGSLRFEESLELIIKLINIYPQTTIVIDALDECDPEKRKRFFKSLRTIVESSTSLVKIFVSSRNDDDIILSLETVPNFWIEATDNAGDIERFVQQEVLRCKDDGDLLRGRVSDALMKKIINSLTVRSRGMFMWVDLQIKHICAMNTPADIETGLNTLPESLEKTYIEIYDRILSQKGKSGEIAKTTLMWVICSKVRTSPENLCTLVSLSAGDCHEFSIDTLLKMCHNLLVIDRRLDVVQVAHLSVREFLEGPQGVGITNAHIMASKFCLSYMMDNTKALDSVPTDEDRWMYGEGQYFAAYYAIDHWIEHMQSSRQIPQNSNQDLSQLLITFLKHPALIRWVELDRDSCARKSSTSDCLCKLWEELTPTLPIQVALCYGLSEASSLWESEFWSIPPGEMELWTTILVFVVGQPHNWVQWAVPLLVDKGVDINSKAVRPGYKGFTALDSAVLQGHPEVVKLLLDKGADVNVAGGRYGSALQAAAYEGKTDIVKLLLDRGADANAAGGRYGSVLEAAVVDGRNTEIVKLLLDKGADINAAGDEYDSALQAAIANRSVSIVKLLLDRGADVNALGDRHGGALQAAVVKGLNIDILKLLLDRGADVNAAGGRYGSALQAAVVYGSIDIIKLLLDRGADVNAAGGKYGSALQTAAYDGETDIVELLLDRGADVNAAGGKYGSALQAAAYGGEADIVELLLDRGADVNAAGGEYGSALQAAVYWSDKDIITILRNRGALEPAVENPDEDEDDDIMSISSG